MQPEAHIARPEPVVIIYRDAERKFACPECSMCFSTARGRDIHAGRMHGDAH